MVLAEKPNISDDTFSLDPAVLDELISHLSTLAAIYHKPPSTFVSQGRKAAPGLGGRADDDDDDDEGNTLTSDMMTEGAEGAQAAPPAMPAPQVMDLLGGLMDDPPDAAPANPMGGMGGMMGGGAPPAGGGLGGGLDDLFGGPPAPSAAAGAAAPAGAKLVLPADKGEGMQVRTAFVKDGQGRLCQSYTVENNGGVPLSGFALQFNKNTFGVVPESPGKLGEVLPQQLMPGQSATGLVPLLPTGQPAADTPPGVIQVALKNSVKVFYFQDSMDVLLFLASDARMDKNVWLEQWKSLTNENRTDAQGLSPQSENVEAVCPKMEAANVFFIARRKLPDGADMVYFSSKTLNNVAMLVELGFRPGTGTCSISIKSAQGLYMPLLAESLQKILRS